LGIDGLDEGGVDTVAAGRKRIAAENAGRLPENEVVVVGVIDLGVEAEIALETTQAELGAVGAFFLEGGVADLECARRVVGPVREQLERARRPLDALHRGARLHPGRQVLDELEADA
jgi:hypothetical protein